MLSLTVAFALAALVGRAPQELLLPELQPTQVGQIEIAHGDELLLLVRARSGSGTGSGTGTGQVAEPGESWQIRSAADAPGDALRIEALLTRLAGLTGAPLAAAADAALRRPAMAVVRLRDADGGRLAEVEFGDGVARVLPDGPELAIARTPALPLWASAWSSLQPPVLPLDRVARVSRLTPDGLRPLGDRDAARVVRILSRLTAQGFRPATEIDWSSDRMLRVQFADGSRLDVAQAPDGSGQYFLRLASDDLPTVKASERFAFRSAESLP